MIQTPQAYMNWLKKVDNIRIIPRISAKNCRRTRMSDNSASFQYSRDRKGLQKRSKEKSAVENESKELLFENQSWFDKNFDS